MPEHMQPPITWEQVEVDGVVLVMAVHPGFDCVFVDHQCSCGVLDVGMPGWVRLDGGTLDLEVVRNGPPWWRPLARRRARRRARRDFTHFAETFEEVPWTRS